MNELIEPLKELLDRGEIALITAVDLSYLEEKEQELIVDQVGRGNGKITQKHAKLLRENAGTLDTDGIDRILHPAAGAPRSKTVVVKIPAEAEVKYFSGLKPKERTELVLQALDAWLVGKEAACV